jgi:hypothetical protein
MNEIAGDTKLVMDFYDSWQLNVTNGQWSSGSSLPGRSPHCPPRNERLSAPEPTERVRDELLLQKKAETTIERETLIRGRGPVGSGPQCVPRCSEIS